MGGCASSPATKAINGEGGSGNESIKHPSTAKVVHMDGRVQELKVPIQAKNITSQNPKHFLCSSESMSIDTCMPQMSDEEELQPGQIYFLVPLSLANKPLTLKDLCSFAIKASSASAIGKDNVDLSSG